MLHNFHNATSGKIETVKMMPGTALFYLQFNQKDANKGKSNVSALILDSYLYYCGIIIHTLNKLFIVSRLLPIYFLYITTC